MSNYQFSLKPYRNQGWNKYLLKAKSSDLLEQREPSTRKYSGIACKQTKKERQ